MVERPADRLTVRQVPQGNTSVWIIEPSGAFAAVLGELLGARASMEASAAQREALAAGQEPLETPSLAPGASGGQEESIRLLREHIEMLRTELDVRKRELHAEQAARRSEVAELHRLLALATRSPFSADLPPRPAPASARPQVPAIRAAAALPEPAPPPGETESAAPPAGQAWWQRLLGRWQPSGERSG